MPTLPTLDISHALTSADPVVDWLIPNFIPRGSLIALAGEPGAGKSFVAYTLSLALATGTPFLGIPLECKRILYFDQENSRPDCTQYLRWAWNGLGQPPLELLSTNLTIAPFILGTKQWATTAAAYVQLHQPDLIIFDTTTPAFAIEDENDNGEATRAINGLRSLQGLVSVAPAIIALKHAKVKPDGGGYTLRGAKAWEGAVDSVVYQIKNAGAPRADGLRSTHLEPSKTRAFGLRESIKIDPQWVNGKAGLKLNRKDDGNYSPKIGRNN